MIFFPILFPFPLLAISLPLPFFASQFDFLVVKSSYCVGNSLHCILKNKVVWCGFLFGFFITLNDKIKILPWKGSNYFIALVQLPPRFFFSLSELVTLQMKNANTLIWSCCLKNTTKQWFATSYVISLSSSPPFFGEEQCCLILQVCQDIVWGGSVLVKGINKRELY